ncbi:STAS domain-containing protein [Nocardia bhagyanarayanae]|uniref:Anti-anti-sigma factor n=1 Tax=Nocardia bhagyanarayanae TaxID=1215925 RepID=A0A543EVF8_9NOCA|nr:STAS domain-containing protein [Nocardia bhagyanarayanae]TQM25564.1 anti-anti-sigma factor [Nocardia bhagyanarayanae]
MSTIFATQSPHTRPHQPEPAARLRVSITAPGDEITLCAVAGEVDQFTVDEFRRHLIGALDTAAPRVVVDLSMVTFFGIPGLRVLFEARSVLEQTGRRLLLVTGPPCVDRLLRVAADVVTFETTTALAGALLDAA